MAGRWSALWAQLRGVSPEPREEQRAITTLPWSVGDVLTPRAAISPETSLRLVPVYAAIGLISRTVSCTPIHAYRRVSDDERVRVALPQLFQLLDSEGQLATWLHRLVACLASRGNAYGLITSRDGFGFPTAITWLDPNQVSVMDTNLSGRGSFNLPVWYWNGREIDRGDMVHIPWFPVPGKVEGLSPLGAAASAISTGLSAQTYADEWFSNGGIPPGTMKNVAKTLTAEESSSIRSRLISAIRNRQPLVYGSDWDYTPIAIAPHEVRFVETAQLTANQIAAIYDVPAERIGGNTGGPLRYSSSEQDQIHLVTVCLRNWYELLEGVFSAMLPNRQYVKFNTDSLVRSDLITRHQVYQIGLALGLYNVDECRAKEDLPPLPGSKGQFYAAPQEQPAQPPPGGGQNTPNSQNPINGSGSSTVDGALKLSPIRRPKTPA